jgi:excinuclease ABC subunit C
MSYLDYPVLKQKISLLPDRPGSYQMKDSNGTIIYVGKAKSLVKRVKQYFTRPQQGKVMRMVMEIRDFDIIETHTEKEALLLEISLKEEPLFQCGSQ